MVGPTVRASAITEADTCRELVTPKLVEAGWSSAPHAIGEQRSFTNGRIIIAGGKVRRGQRKRADYLLYYRRDYPLAVVEAQNQAHHHPRRQYGCAVRDVGAGVFFTNLIEVEP